MATVEGGTGGEALEDKLTDEPGGADLSALVEGGQDRSIDDPVTVTGGSGSPLKLEGGGGVDRPSTPLNMSNEDQSLNSTLTYTTAFDDNNESASTGTGTCTGTGASNNLASVSTSALSATASSEPVASGGGGQEPSGGGEQLSSNQSDSDVYKDTRESLERDSNTNTEADVAVVGSGTKDGGASESDADDDDDPSKYEDSRQPEEDSPPSNSNRGAAAENLSDEASYEDEDDADDENESGLPDDASATETPNKSAETGAQNTITNSSSKPRHLKHQSTNGSNSSASVDPSTIPPTKKDDKFYGHDDRQGETDGGDAKSVQTADQAAGEESEAKEGDVTGEGKAAARKSPERWSHDKFKQDSSTGASNRKPKQPRNRNRNSKTADETTAQAKEGDENASAVTAPVAKSNPRPKTQRPPREPKASEAKETSASDVKEDTPPVAGAASGSRSNQPRTPKSKGAQGGAKKPSRPRPDDGQGQDVPLSEYIESTESGDKSRGAKRPDSNKKPSGNARRNSDNNNEGAQRPAISNKFGPSQNVVDAKPARSGGRRRSDNEIVGSGGGDRPASQQQQQRRAYTDKKSEPRSSGRGGGGGGLNPDLRKRLDFSTRVQTYDDEEEEYLDDYPGFEGIDNVDEPVSLKITVNRNAGRTVMTAEPDEAPVIAVSNPRQGGGDRGPRASNPNKFKPSQQPADQYISGQQSRRTDNRYPPAAGNGSYHPRQNQEHPFGNHGNGGHRQQHHYQEDSHFDQYHDHRQSGGADQNRPRGQATRNPASRQDVGGTNFADYMQQQQQQQQSSFENRAVPFVKSQSFSNSKLRNRNAGHSQPQQQQQQQQQSFGEYQQSHSLTTTAAAPPQHESGISSAGTQSLDFRGGGNSLVDLGNGNGNGGHFNHHHQQQQQQQLQQQLQLQQLQNQFGMYQQQNQGGAFRDQQQQQQGRQIRGAGNQQEQQRPFASNSPFDAARHFTPQQQQQLLHSLANSNKAALDFNQYNLNANVNVNPLQQQQQHQQHQHQFYNDQGQL